MKIGLSPTRARLHVHDLHGRPRSQHLVLPGDDLARNGEVVLRQFPLAGRQPVVETHLVVAQHPVGREIRSDFGNTFFHRSHPRTGNTVGIPVVVFRHDLLFDRIVNHLGVEFVLILRIGKDRLHRQCPTGTLLISLDPPAVEHLKTAARRSSRTFHPTYPTPRADESGY